MRGSIVPLILPQLAVVALFSVAVKYLYHAEYVDLSAVTALCGVRDSAVIVPGLS